VNDADVIIVGTGPAGVSAAFPLVEAGLRVLLIDGGRVPRELRPTDSYLELRQNANSQWKLFLGSAFEALAAPRANSPKFRAPTLTPVFEGFQKAYAAELDNFTLVGSLASGGLSNAWGAGVAQFNDADLQGFPITASDLAPSYEAIAQRIGISGAADDDLQGLFGSIAALQKPTTLDRNADILLTRYQAQPSRAQRQGIRLGRARNAVLTEALNGREACDRSTLCLWGCGRRAIYSARYDLEHLLKQANCRHAGATVHAIRRTDAAFTVEGCDRNNAPFLARAPRVILACGAVGTAKFVFDLVGHRNKPVSLLSTPSAAFAVLIPQRLGTAIEPKGFGLAQISFSADLAPSGGGPAFGNIFGTAGIPLYEFVRHAPMSRLAGLHLFRVLLPAMLIGNCFLPGEYSAHRLSLKTDGGLLISGGYHDETSAQFGDIRRRLARCMRAYGMMLLPLSFSWAEPGSDAHYGGTVPMKADAAPHESTRDGEVAGASGLYVADGAALTRLPAKAHTLTIMANADRIARRLAAQFRGAQL
jgi:choline dehydrogenase-like flavoprotein